MTPDRLELALKKQRLTLQSAALREQFARHAVALTPALSAIDRVRDGARWLMHHPEWVALGVAAIMVARPRVAWRWARRSFLAWQLWHRLDAWSHSTSERSGGRFAQSPLLSFIGRGSPRSSTRGSP